MTSPSHRAPISRRALLGSAAATAAAVTSLTSEATAADDKPRTFSIWASGCSHVGTDLRKGRESLADAIRQSEQGGDEGGPAFDWDIALHLGDFSGTQGTPNDEEGHEVVRQFAALKQHRREQFYTLAGNHDATPHTEPTQWWFRKWLDPTGEHTEHSGVDASRMPYPVEGTWERYAIRVGNLLILMMSDRNDFEPPVGRGPRGGYPAGAVTGETFAWWKEMVETNRDAIVISAHHHMLKETTVASGPYEGFKQRPDGTWVSHYHGFFADGGPEGASYLYYVDGKPDAQAFERYLSKQPGAIDMWLGGHTHTHPDDRTGGRSHIERKWDVNLVNCASLSRHHAYKTTVPISRLLTFTEGSSEVRVECYLHTSDYAPQGFYKKVERTLPLSKPLRLA